MSTKNHQLADFVSQAISDSGYQLDTLEIQSILNSLQNEDRMYFAGQSGYASAFNFMYQSDVLGIVTRFYHRLQRKVNEVHREESLRARSLKRIERKRAQFLRKRAGLPASRISFNRETI